MCLFLGISLQILMLGYLVAGWLLKSCDNFAEYFSNFFVYFLDSVSCISLLLPVACLVAQAGGRREGGGTKTIWRENFAQRHNTDASLPQPVFRF